jgi:hypothetical protein
MAYTIFSVPEPLIGALGSTAAVDLVADLLWAEARRVGFPTTAVTISKATTVADGGIDAKVAAATVPEEAWKGSFIPDELTCFQIKTGTSFKPWQEGDLKEELFGKNPPSLAALSNGVRACLESGGTYVLICTALDPVEPNRTTAIANLRQLLATCGFPDAKVDVWGQSTLTGFVQRFPALALKATGNSSAHLQSHNVWASQEEMRRRLELGKSQADFIDTVATELRRSEGAVHVHVRGDAGIGKTRLVLEATTFDDLQPLVVYCDSPSTFLSGPLMAALQHEAHDLVAIVVVDECDVTNRAAIWNALKSQSPRVKLITIYNDLHEPTGTTVIADVPILDDAQVAAIIEAYGVPHDDARRWAPLCGGSPRVGHVVGQNLNNNPDDMLREPDTVIVWDRYIVGGDDEAQPAVRQRRLVLRYISLFRRFGYGSAYIAEAQFIADLVQKADPDITWNRFQEIVKLLRDRKILQGETTLYITPRLLHIKLWTEWWETYGTGFDVKQFVEGLPSSLANWYHEMFIYARESGVASKVVTDLLKPDTPYGDVGFLADGRGSMFFRALSEAAPHAGLAFLKRTIGTMTAEELLAFEGDPRRQVVWALEAAAVWREHFEDAARLLLKLAEAENEKFANNATGEFTGLFSLAYGPVAPTEAPPSDRLPLLREAIESKSKKIREVALQAFDTALDTGSSSRIVGAEYQGLRQPPQLWMPPTWDELFDAYRGVWNLLVQKLATLQDEERKRGIQILANHIRGLCQAKPLFSLVMETLVSLTDKYPESRLPIVKALEETLHYDRKSFDDERLSRLEALRTSLVNKDFHSRLQRYVGMDLIHETVSSEEIDSVEAKLSELAEEALANPDQLLPELDWLVSGNQGNNGFRFGLELAKRDEQFALMDTLLDAQRRADQGGGAFFLSGYFSGLFQRDGELWESTLDRMALDEALRHHVSELTWRSGVTQRAAIRVLALVESKKISPNSLRLFAYGGVARHVPEPVFEKWIEALLAPQTKEGVAIAVDLVHSYYLFGEARPSLPQGLTRRVLTADAFFQQSDARRFFSQVEYDWIRVATAFLERFPEEGPTLSAALLQAFGEEGTLTEGFNSQVTEVLTTVSRRFPSEVWAQIVSVVGPPMDSRAFKVTRWLREGGLSWMRPTDVWNWIDADIEKRARFAASFVPSAVFRSEAQTSWARELLVRYGHRADVRASLHANAGTEFWSGPASSHYQSKKASFEELKANEDDPNVRLWLDEEIESLTARIEQWRITEERDF